MYLAHGPISYIANEILQKKRIKKLDGKEDILVMILSILFGIFPDIDLAFLSMTAIPPFQHHLIFTHSILYFVTLWIVLNILLFGLKKILNKDTKKVLSDNLIYIIQLSFLIGTLSHLFADILFSYSRTFFPFEQQITILGGILKTNYFTGYLFTPSFAVEILSVGVFLLLLAKKYLLNSKVIKALVYTFIIFSTLYLSLSIYMNLNTYNKDTHFKNSQQVKDGDHDGILDSYDSDTDNDGVNNLMEVNREELSEFISRVSSGKYFTTSKDTFLDELKHTFGAFNSYRVISQAYFEQNLAIEQVLIEYAKEKYSINGYVINKSYPTLLYEYISEKEELKDYSMDTPQGYIFFILEEEKVVNMGITLKENMFGTVLAYDTRLVTHTLDDLFIQYPNSTIKVEYVSPE